MNSLLRFFCGGWHSLRSALDIFGRVFLEEVPLGVVTAPRWVKAIAFSIFLLEEVSYCPKGEGYFNNPW